MIQVSKDIFVSVNTCDNYCLTSMSARQRIHSDQKYEKTNIVAKYEIFVTVINISKELVFSVDTYVSTVSKVIA